MRITRRARALLPLGLLISAAPPQELPTVFGLSLGKPLSIPVCARKLRPDGTPSQFVYQDDPAETCSEPDIQLSDAPWRRGNVDFPVKRMPLILHINSGYTLIVDGKLEGLEFSTLGYANTNGIIDELTAKFGRPTAVRRITASPSGVPVPATHAEWRLLNLHVSYRSIDYSVEYGLLQIETSKMQALRLAHQRDQERHRTAL